MTYQRNHRTYQHTNPRHERAHIGEQGFTCRNCKLYVSCAPSLAGVQNRNHCPFCLWSRHLDGLSAGDRGAGCRGKMRPVGLTTKRGRNKYANQRDGELMIIHRCTVCAKIVINRIAADDGAAMIFELFERSCAPDAAFLAELEALGVAILTASERDLVRQRLFGAQAALN